MVASALQHLDAQVPVEITSPSDTISPRYTEALKEAVLNSGTFRLETPNTSSTHLRATVAVGGLATCGDTQFRAVAIVVTVASHSGANKAVSVVTAVYEMGNEEESARHQLARLEEIAEAFGIPSTSH